MKKKAVIAVVVIVVLVVAAFVIHFHNSQTEIPDKELIYMQLQLDGKGEEFVMSQFEGCTREELIAKWGNPDGMLSGFYGDIWTITETESIIVYYSAGSTVEHIKLQQNENNNSDYFTLSPFWRYSMERKYPTKMFWLFVLTNFLFHFFYLSVPGIILCIVGIWVKTCLWIGLAILGLDLILSIIEQLRIRKAALTPSDNPEFNELMDAFCGPGGLDAVRKIVDDKIKSTNTADHHEEEN